MSDSSARPSRSWQQDLSSLSLSLPPVPGFRSQLLHILQHTAGWEAQGGDEVDGGRERRGCGSCFAVPECGLEGTAAVSGKPVSGWLRSGGGKGVQSGRTPLPAVAAALHGRETTALFGWIALLLQAGSESRGRSSSDGRERRSRSSIRERREMVMRVRRQREDELMVQ